MDSWISRICGNTASAFCENRREAAQKLSIKGKGVVREQVPSCLMQFCLLTLFCSRQSNPRIVHSGPAWLCMTHRRRLGLEPKVKISEGGESRDENLKALHTCFFRCWTGTYYWCFSLGDAHTDKLDVVKLLGATRVSESPRGTFIHLWECVGSNMEEPINRELE